MTPGKPAGARGQATRTIPVAARLLVALAVAALLAAVFGGLLRAGALSPAIAGLAPVQQAAIFHASLMICAFFGTVIGIERAVALGRRWAFGTPLLAGLAGIATLAGSSQAASALFLLAALLFVAVNLAIVARQRATHTVLLLVAAGSWATGAALQVAIPGTATSIAWWFGFLVITIAAERLELTRLMPRRPGSQSLLLGATAGIIAGATLVIIAPTWGGALYGVSLLVLACWGWAFDIARRTIRTRGVTRYMAACLLAGYFWLGIGGLAWCAEALGWAAARDAALHSIGLGFVFDMVMAHALVILPAVARIRVPYGPVFYLGFGLMQVSLAIRLFGPLIAPRLHTFGATLNALAILAFALTVAGAAATGGGRTRSGPRA